MPRTAKKPTATSSVGGSGQSAAPVTPARVQPITVPTGQPYGEAKALADAQRQLPLPQAPGVPSPTVSQQPTGNPLPAALTAAQTDTSPPVNLGAPTARPNEPVTAGLPSGPGPGPEIMPAPAPDNLPTLLARLASAPGAPNEIAQLAAYVNSGRR